MTTATLQLTPSQLELVAKVATRDLCHTQEFTASDIAAVTIHDGMVDIYFNQGGKTMVDIATFREWIAEYKAQEQLSEEQTEIIEAAIDSPFQSEVNFQDAIASFYAEYSRFVGTVRKDRHDWLALTETEFTIHKSASDAVQSLTTCTYEEWEEAVEGVQGIRYEGNGFWRYCGGAEGLTVDILATSHLLKKLGIAKTDRQIAILERQIAID